MRHDTADQGDTAPSGLTRRGREARGKDDGRPAYALRQALALVDAFSAGLVTEALARVEGTPLVARPELALGPAGAERDDDVAAAVLDRALADPRLDDLAPRVAVRVALEVIGTAVGSVDCSIWSLSGPQSLECLASVGEGATRRFSAVAQQAIDDAAPSYSGKRVAVVAAPVAVGDLVADAIVVRLGEEPGLGSVGPLLAVGATRLSALLGRDRLATTSAAAGAALVEGSERRLARMAYDLHDGPLQELTSLAEELRHVGRDIAALVPGAARPTVEEGLGSVHERAARLEALLREIAQSIEGANPSRPSLEGLLDRERRSLRRRGIELEFDVPSLDGLTHSQQIALYRGVQEAVSNIARHSQAQKATVVVVRSPENVVATISDDGSGIDLEALGTDPEKQARLGLAGMQARARLLGGDVTIRSRPGEGTTVRMALPHWEPPREPATYLS